VAEIRKRPMHSRVPQAARCEKKEEGGCGVDGADGRAGGRRKVTIALAVKAIASDAGLTVAV
jgi:hypothetical protein